MATEILETERKYEAQPGVTLPPLDTLPEVAEVSVPETETLVAEYYDTDDLRLLKAGASTRLRNKDHLSAADVAAARSFSAIADRLKSA